MQTKRLQRDNRYETISLSTTGSGLGEVRELVTETQAPAESQTIGIMFQVPKVLAEAIDAQASEHKMPKSRWIREFIAESLGIVLPPTERARVKKYATVEEREAAQKKRQETQRDVYKALMAKYRTELGLGSAAGIEDMARELGLLSDEAE